MISGRLCFIGGHPHCGNGTWMRIGHFDLNRGVGCPSSLNTYTYNSKQYCRRSVDEGCSSVYFDSLGKDVNCLLYTSPSPRDRQKSRMPSSA